MSLENLYQEIILDHYRNPRNFEELEDVSASVEHENPVCGDNIKLMIRINNDKLEAVKFHGHGCAISMASASIMTDELEGKTVEDSSKIIENVILALRGEKEADVLEDYGDMTALGGVIQFPVRVKCATLAWNALRDAMAKK